MTRKERVVAVAQVLRGMVFGRPSEAMAEDLMRELRKFNLEIVLIPITPEQRRAQSAAEHDVWATTYEVQAAEYEAAGNTIGAENRRQMARESRERAAILRGGGVQKP